MARELSETLEATQHLGIITPPYLIAKIRRKWGGVIRFDWESIYAGEEDNSVHTATMPSDGSLVRLRVSDPEGEEFLYYQRITSPDDESDFSVWSDLSIPNITGVASCSNGADVSQFYLTSSGDIYWRVSDDSGANWGAWGKILEIWPTGANGIAAAYKPNGDICLTYLGVHVLREHVDTGDTSHAPCYGSIWRRQDFDPTESHNLGYIDLKLSRTGLPGTATVELWDCTGFGRPLTTKLGTVTFDADDLTDVDAGEWKRIDFTDQALDTAKQYAIVMYAPAGDVDNKVWWRLNSNDPYATEDAWESVDSGGNWINEYPNDTLFREYGYIVFPGSPTLYTYFEDNGATWTISANTAEVLANNTGISIYYHQDWNIIATAGAEDEVKSVSQCIYGDGGSEAVGDWSAWDAIIERGTTEPFNYHAPFAGRPDTTRLYFVEEFTQEETQQRLYYSHSPEAADFADNAWLEPVPMNVESEFGLCPCNYGNYAWLTNANSVYRALTTDEELDISSKLLIVDMDQQPDIRKGKVTITVNNLAGVYNAFDRLGDELTIGIGYVTGAGNEYSLTSSFWITKYKLASPSWSIWHSLYPIGILGTLIIEAQDAWDFLKRYKTRRPYSWSLGEKTVLELLTFFIARAGLTFEVQSSSSAAQNFKPDFEIDRGASYRTIVKNLLKMIPDQLIFREYKAILRNPTTAEDVDWVYHNTIGTANLVFRGQYGTSAQDPNRAEVWGDTFMKMAANWPQIATVRDRLSRVTSPEYPDLTRAGERADAELRRAEILTGEESWMLASVNCGLEPWDKIQITDQASGVTDILRRVIRISTYWSARSWQYTQILKLGAD